jgi:hypothetical protein
MEWYPELSQKCDKYTACLAHELQEVSNAYYKLVPVLRFCVMFYDMNA